MDDFEFKEEIVLINEGKLDLDFSIIKRYISEKKFNDNLKIICESINKKKYKSEYIKKYYNLLYKKGATIDYINNTINNLIKNINNNITHNNDDIIIDNIPNSTIDNIIFLMKDSAKQNIPERFKLEFIKYNGWNITQLPKGSNKIKNDGALYLCNGELMKKNNKQYNPQKSSKSIDFKIENNIYVYDKTTYGSGGSQDNQYKDAKDFLYQSIKTNDNNFYIALLDGDYYINKIDELRMFNDDNVRVCNIYNIFDTLKKWT